MDDLPVGCSLAACHASPPQPVPLRWKGLVRCRYPDNRKLCAFTQGPDKDWVDLIFDGSTPCRDYFVGEQCAPA